MILKFFFQYIPKKYLLFKINFFSIFNISNIYHDEIDNCISKNIFRYNSNGLLYCLIEPEIDDYPNYCIFLSPGNSSIFSYFKGCTNLKYENYKNKACNIKIFIYQNYSFYRNEYKKFLSLDEGFIEINNEALNFFKSIFSGEILFFGHSLGSYNSSRISKNLAIICNPFDIYEEIGISTKCKLIEDISKNKSKIYLCISGKYDNVCLKTIPKISNYENVYLKEIETSHYFSEFGYNLFNSLIEVFIELNEILK